MRYMNVLLAALAVTACGPRGPLPAGAPWGAAPSAVLAPEDGTAAPRTGPQAMIVPPQAPAVRTPAPPARQRPKLRPGEELTLDVAPGERRLLLLANPADDDCLLGVHVSPEGPSPAASPSPSATPAIDRTPPFGFAFDASLAARPITGGRKLLAAPPRTYAVGDREAFWVNDGSATIGGDRRRDVVLRLVTPHAYFFVDESGDVAIDEARLAKLAAGFERLRPPLVRVSGEEAKPGIDGVDRLFVVVSPWVGQAPGHEGMLGYFWPRDVVPRDDEDETDLRHHANEKEVIFLATPILEEPEVTSLGTLAHEYQHLLTFSAKSRANGGPKAEATWLDEGFSMLAMDLAGFGGVADDPFVRDEVDAFLRDPLAYSLTDFRGNPDGRSYGLSYLFVRDLVGRYGLGVITDALRAPETGIEGLDAALAARGASFEEAFLAWARTAAEAAQEGDANKGPVATTLEGPTSIRLRPWGVGLFEAGGMADGPRNVRLQRASRPLAWWDGVIGAVAAGRAAP